VATEGGGGVGEGEQGRRNMMAREEGGGGEGFKKGGWEDRKGRGMRGGEFR